MSLRRSSLTTAPIAVARCTLMGGLGPAAVAAPVSDLGGVTLRQLVPVTFPGEGYAYLWTEHYRPKPALDFVRHDLALAAGIRPHS